MPAPHHRHDNAPKARCPASAGEERLNVLIIPPLARARGGREARAAICPRIAPDSLAWCLGLRRWSDFTV